MQQLCKDANNNKILEAFACGTAATIVSINKFKYENGEVLLTNNSVSAKLRRKLQNIQFGLEEDKYNWIEIIN